MAVIEGNVSGSISTVPFNIPCKIISGYLTNRTGGNVIVNLYVVTGTGDRAIIPINLTLISGQMYIITEEIVMKPGYYFIIVSNASLDYYFSIA